MNSLLTDLTAPQLRKAATLKEKIDELESELRQILGTPQQPSGRSRALRTTTEPVRAQKRHKMSPAARAKIAAAARARWKKAKAAGRNTL